MTYTEAANDLVHAICTHYDVDPKNVRDIHITPRAITIDLYELNNEGRKFIKEDGNVAIRRRTLPFEYTPAHGVF